MAEFKLSNIDLEITIGAKKLTLKTSFHKLMGVSTNPNLLLLSLLGEIAALLIRAVLQFFAVFDVSEHFSQFSTLHHLDFRLLWHKRTYPSIPSTLMIQ